MKEIIITPRTAYVFETEEEAHWIFKVLKENGYSFDVSYKDFYIPKLDTRNFIATDPSRHKRLYHSHTNNDVFKTLQAIYVKDIMKDTELEQALKIIYED